jgi:hypothetical protein
MKRFLIVAIVSLLWPASAHAQPVIDGRADVADGYGAALSTQNTNTQFGNATNGDAVNGGGGSEINQVFGRVSGGRLYVTIAGNLETNFNKMEVFIDSVAGGVNRGNGVAGWRRCVLLRRPRHHRRGITANGRPDIRRRF